MPLIPLLTPSLTRFHSSPSLPASSNTSTVQPAQTTHRLAILDAWGGKREFEGAQVLEIGCGQGDMSVVLAAAVSGEEEGGGGRVVAWDPADGDYGSPDTLSQAQATILSHPALHPCLTFSLTTPLPTVLSPSHTYTHAVLAHSMYYFPSRSVLLATFRAIHAHSPPIEKLCLAEYGLRASGLEQVPHLLAVMAQTALESLRSDPEGDGLGQSNVTTALSPAKYLEVAREAGWVADYEEYITPSAELQDGGWEVGSVCGERWLGKVGKVLGEGGGRDREKAWIEGMRDATISAVEQVVEVDEGKVRTMDVWCAVLKRGEV